APIWWLFWPVQFSRFQDNGALFPQIPLSRKKERCWFSALIQIFPARSCYARLNLIAYARFNGFFYFKDTNVNSVSIVMPSLLLTDLSTERYGINSYYQMICSEFVLFATI